MEKKTYKDFCKEEAAKHGWGNLVGGHKVGYFEEAAKMFAKYEVEQSIENRKSPLVIIKIFLKKSGLKFHEIKEKNYTYIQLYNEKDVEGFIYVEGHGLIELKNSAQLQNFMEFCNGELVSY